MSTSNTYEHPADAFYMIEPAGEHLNKTVGAVQVIDDLARQSMVNRFNADAKAGKLSHGKEMLIDAEHFKHDASKATTAYGWLFELQNRSDGMYGKIRWTHTGKAAVDGGDYRFFSTEYDPKDMENLGSDRVRPLRLDGLTLTNMPNNHGGKPITNRGPAPHLVLNVDSEQAACALFGKLVNRIQKELGLRHDDAWMMARVENFSLYCQSIGESAAVIANRAGGAEWLASAKLGAASRRIAIQNKISFSNAQILARSRLPAINAVILNRSTDLQALLKTEETSA